MFVINVCSNLLLQLFCKLRQENNTSHEPDEDVKGIKHKSLPGTPGIRSTINNDLIDLPHPAVSGAAIL